MGLTSDEQAIANLLFRYARAMDAGDFDAVAELFARGLYFGVPGHAVTKMLSATVILHDGKMGTKHVTTNLEIEQDTEDSAVVRSYFTVFQQLPTLPMQPVIAGRYTDRVAKDADGWYFVDRVADLELVGDISQHVSYTP